MLIFWVTQSSVLLGQPATEEFAVPDHPTAVCLILVFGSSLSLSKVFRILPLYLLALVWGMDRNFGISYSLVSLTLFPLDPFCFILFSVGTNAHHRSRESTLTRHLYLLPFDFYRVRLPTRSRHPHIQGDEFQKFNYMSTNNKNQVNSEHLMEGILNGQKILRL